MYDQLGRQLTVPSVDAPNPGGGNVALAYFHDDSAKSITQGNTVLSYGLDVAGRRGTQTTTVSGSVTSTVVNHYTDDSDSPGWITNAQGGSTATTVYADLVAEDLSLSLISGSAGSRGELALTTPRGDVAATITLATPSATAAGLDSWTRYTEYGAPVTAQPVGQAGAAGNGYGWLGGKQRTTTATIGLLLMGARLYNPVTGLFTSLDPVYGGNDTAYGYPNDPINKQDTTGQKGFWRKVGKWAWKNKWEIALTVASFIPATAGVAWAYRGYKLARGGIYVAKTLSGAKYVGQSGKVGRRLSQHVKSGKISRWQAATAKVYRIKGGKTRREVAEQRMIKRHGGIRGGKLANKVNPIGERRKKLLETTGRNWRGL